MEIQEDPKEIKSLSIDEHKDFPSFVEWFRDYKSRQKIEAGRWNTRRKRK